MEDWHHQISTWKVQVKDQELLDPAVLVDSVCSRMESKCKAPKSRSLLQENSWCVGREGAPGCQDTEMDQAGDKVPPKHTPGRAAHCSNSVKEPWSTLAVEIIWLHFFKNVISLPTVRNIFVVSCWFCWSSGNSERLTAKKSDTIGSSDLLSTAQEDGGFVLYYYSTALFQMVSRFLRSIV